MSDLDEVLKRLPKLSAADLDQVRIRLKALDALGGGPIERPRLASHHEQKREWRDFLLDCISTTLRAHMGFGISREAISKMSMMASFNRKLPAIEEFLEKAAQDFRQRRAICVVGIDLLYQHLAAGGDVGAPQLLRSIHRLPELLENQFPGYARMSLLGLIARRNEKEPPNRGQ